MLSKIDNGIDPGRFQESLHAGRVEYELENEECDKKHFPLPEKIRCGNGL